jgi:lysozyme family protein
MAEFLPFLPHLLRWEAGVLRRKGETLASQFERARATGYSNRADDKGGPTMIGVTLTTYRLYCSSIDYPEPDIAALQAIPLEHWRDVAKRLYWDRCWADLIRSQSVAEMLVDWAYNAGVANAVRGVQRVVGATEDGYAGPKTLAAINALSPQELFCKLRQARLAYYDKVVLRDPSQSVFLEGWRRRTNSITFKS